MARLGHRADKDYRSTDQSHGTWRERIGCVPPGDSVDAGLRIFRQADHSRLGPRPHRACLGYTQYVAQGGDWGALITDLIGVLAPPELLAIHTNMPGAVPNDINGAAFTGAPVPSGLAADEQHAFDRLAFFYKKGLGYALEMGNRPQTLYGVADSPVGLAAWILDHDEASEALMARVFAGQSEGLMRDDILDNITLYWLTNTAISSARLYWENKLAFFAPKNVAIPVAVSIFPDEIYAAPRSWAERAYPKLIHYNRLPKGCHFAAWEQPQFFSEEVRAGFRSLRSNVAKSDVPFAKAG